MGQVCLRFLSQAEGTKMVRGGVDESGGNGIPAVGDGGCSSSVVPGGGATW